MYGKSQLCYNKKVVSLYKVNVIHRSVINREILCHLCNSNVYYLVQRRRPLTPILSQRYLFNIHFNITLQQQPRHFECFPPPPSSPFTSFPLYVIHSPPSYSPYFHRPVSFLLNGEHKLRSSLLFKVLKRLCYYVKSLNLNIACFNRQLNIRFPFIMYTILQFNNY